MLAIVDYEHEEDMRVFGYSRDPAPRYVNLREAARGALEEAGAPVAPTGDNRPESPGRNAPGREVASARGRNRRRHDHRVQELRRRTDGDLPEPRLRRPRPLLLDPGRTLRRPGGRHRSVAERRTHPPAPERAGPQLLARLRTPPAPEPLGAAAGFRTYLRVTTRYPRAAAILDAPRHTHHGPNAPRARAVARTLAALAGRRQTLAGDAAEAETLLTRYPTT